MSNSTEDFAGVKRRNFIRFMAPRSLQVTYFKSFVNFRNQQSNLIG